MFSPFLEERFSLFAIRFSLAALQSCHPERRVRALRRPDEESKDPYRVCVRTVPSLKGLGSIFHFTQHFACGSVLG
jgi:hypothetical protein